jgi:ABC-type sugar transport system permease subunit
VAENKPKKRRRLVTMQRRQMIYGLLFISPFLVGITFFFLWNLFTAARYSFSQLEIVPGVGLYLHNVGMDNFYAIFREHGSFMQEMFGSAFQLVISVPLIIFFSLFMAILLNRQFLGRGLVRAIFFLPVIMGSAAIVASIDMAAGMMMGGASPISPDADMGDGAFNAMIIVNLLTQLQVPPQFSEFIVTAIGNLHDVIRSSGVQIIIFLAALQSIPPSVYEVAQIEGATSYETFWKITIPMVSPLIITNVVYTIVDQYTEAEVLTIIQDTLDVGNHGAATAMHLSSALLVTLVLGMVCWVLSRFIFYRD